MSEIPEAWFRRVFLWGSVPIHWKGAAVILIAVAIAVGGANVAAALGHPGMGGLCVLVGVGWGFAMAETHMERRDARNRKRVWWWD